MADLDVGNGMITGVQLTRVADKIQPRVFYKKVKDLSKAYLGRSQAFEEHFGRKNPVDIKDYRVGLLKNYEPGYMYIVGEKKLHYNERVKFAEIDRSTSGGRRWGQKVFPFFDPRPVTLKYPRPISGIGFLRLTDSPQNAGYIRPYLKSIDYRTFDSSYKSASTSNKSR